jgi:hypothetical protein
MMILMEAAVAGAAALQCCGQWQLADDEVAMENEVASKVDPQRGQSVRSDIAIVTTLSPVTCMYIYSSLSLCIFSLLWDASHGPALRGAGHHAQGRESIFGCFATRHVYMSAAYSGVHWALVQLERGRRRTIWSLNTTRIPAGRAVQSLFSSLLFPSPPASCIAAERSYFFLLFSLTFY